MSFNLRENYIGNVSLMSTILFFRLEETKKVIQVSPNLIFLLKIVYYSFVTSLTTEAIDATLSRLLGRKIFVALPSAILANDS